MSSQVNAFPTRKLVNDCTEGPFWKKGEKRMDNKTQQDLVAAAKEGDKAAFEKLYNEYRNKIYFFAFKNTGTKEAAEDIVSETFLTAMEKIGELKSEEAFGSWL